VDPINPPESPEVIPKSTKTSNKKKDAPSKPVTRNARPTKRTEQSLKNQMHQSDDHEEAILQVHQECAEIRKEIRTMINGKDSKTIKTSWLVILVVKVSKLS